MRVSMFGMMILIIFLVLTACSSSDSGSISLKEEFEEYRMDIIEPFNDRAIKIAEMGGQYTMMLEETEDAYNYYLNDELIPYAKGIASEFQQYKEGDYTSLYQNSSSFFFARLEKTLASLYKTSEILKLATLPPTEETYSEGRETFR